MNFSFFDANSVDLSEIDVSLSLIKNKAEEPTHPFEPLLESENEHQPPSFP
jgi:hypothetical protein